MFPILRQDYERLRAARGWSPLRGLLGAALLDNGFQAVILFRLASWFKRHRWPLLGPLVTRVSTFLTGVEIAPGADIGPGFLISHGQGLVIGQWATLGRDVMIHHQVTIGAATLGKLETMPTIGDRVFIGAGAKIIGGVTIGDDAIVGVNAVVTRDIPAGAKAIAKGGLHVVKPDG